MTVTVLMDLLVAGLLVAAIVYCVLLNRRLGALRSDKGKLGEAVQGLQDVSVRAEASVAALRATAEEIGRSLEEKIEQGRKLREDLAYMLDRGGGIADKLEGAIRVNRHAGSATSDAAPATANAAVALEAAARALERRRRPEPAAAPAPAPQATPRPAAEAGAAEKPSARIAGFPSRIERELRRALDGRR